MAKPRVQRSTINDFMSNVRRDFARPNMFQVNIDFPNEIIRNADINRLGKFTVRAANLPSSQIGVVEVPFRGRSLKIAGDRTFEPWTITIMNDSKFILRSAFERWASAIQAYNENYTSADGLQSNNRRGYFADMEVFQLSRDLKRGGKKKGTPKVLKGYKFYDVFPSNISGIDLDFGNNDAIEEFTVELQVQYWTPVRVNQKSNAGGNKGLPDDDQGDLAAGDDS